MSSIKAMQIIGTQRSGSNLLRVMLNQIQEIEAPHPPHILQRFSPLLSKYGELDNESNFNQLIDDVCKLIELNPVPWKEFELDRKLIRQRCRSNSLIEVFNSIYSLKAEYSNARYWCCKSMANFKYANEFEELDIKPFYIYLYRDGRDVALSFKKAIVGSKHTYHIAKQWKEDQEHCLQLKGSFGENRFFSICYEQLLANPENTLKRLCGFLKIPFNNSMLEYYNSEESWTTACSGKMWKNVSQPLLKNNTNKFLKHLSDEDQAIFECIAGATLEKLDFKLYKTKFLNSFSKKDIEKFNIENELLKQKTLVNACEEDLKRKKEQLNLLKEIRNRNNVHCY